MLRVLEDQDVIFVDNEDVPLPAEEHSDNSVDFVKRWIAKIFVPCRPQDYRITTQVDWASDTLIRNA
jgi:hypothetical protein